jgi:hypothetical protein
MKSLKLQTCYAVASTAVLVGLAACAGESTSTGPFKSPTSARFAVGASTNATPELGKVKVCKSASSNVSGEFDVTRTAVGASTGSAADATVAPNDCVIVAEDMGGSGVGSNITVDETSAGFQSVSAVRIDALVAGGTQTSAQAYTDGSTSLFVNSFHGFVVTYVNTIHQNGCTYTQGWYKNPKHQWPAGNWSNFDGTGVSYLGTLETPPKGNVYYILAHQYIAATLNVAAGSSSSDITQALADAAAYFAAASPNNPLPGTYTKDQVTAIAAALDAYNNGITGPGHCDDEVLTVQ